MAIRKRTDYIVLHVTATRPLTPAGITEVTAMHKARGFSTIGYHYVIRLDGKIEKGRPENQVGAHVQGYNSVSLGIALEGGLSQTTGKPADTRTPAPVEALIDLIHDLLTRYPKARICGHRDLSPDRDGDGVIEPHEYLKECPCFDAIPWAKQNGLPAADIKGRWQISELPGGTLVAGNTVQNGPDKPAVENQKLLRRAGYEFGPLDGIVGKKTIAALGRFQKAAGLPLTNKFDKATLSRLRAVANAPVKAALEADTSLKVIPPAVPATAKVLAAKGSATIQTANLGQIAAATGALTGVLTTAGETIKVIEQVQSTAKDAQDVMLKLAAVWPSASLMLIAGLAYFLFQRVKKIRVEEHNNGTNISRREPIEFLRLTDVDLKID